MPLPAAHLGEVVQALSITYNNLVYEMKARGTDVIVLSLGEAFFDIPFYGFDEMPLPASYHYSHSRGNAELRRRLAAFYCTQYGVPVDHATEIIVTTGSKAAIHMSLMAILNPGDEVLVLEPAWVSYSEQVKLCHGVAVMVPQYTPIHRLEPFITERTRAIVVNNPNNPSGRVYTRDELAQLHTLADLHDCFLIADEAYSEFLLGGTYLSCGALDPEKRHTIVCNSMSKNFGLSGWRIGYVIASPALTSEILKINQHLVTCPPSILEHYLVRHFDNILEITKPQIAAVVQKRRELVEYIEARGMTCLPGEATFYIFVSITPSRLSSAEFCTRLLTEYGVSVVPGIGYGRSCDDYIRLSVGAEDTERIKRGIRLIGALIDETAVVPSGNA
jgi:aminotransferase